MMGSSSTLLLLSLLLVLPWLDTVQAQTQKFTLITTLTDKRKFSGNFGGFEGADRLCQSPKGGYSPGYVALLKGNPSLSTVTGGNLDQSYDFYDINGNHLFVASFNGIFGKHPPVAKGNIVDRNGKYTFDYDVWTGADGDQCEGPNNKPWTFGELSEFGGHGQPTVGDQWILSGSQYCNIAHMLYCILPQSAVRGDPHFVGFNGCKFDFDGEDGQIFAIYSDWNLQVNALFQHLQVGTVSGNWMTQLGIRTPEISLVLNPASGVLDTTTGEVFASSMALELNSTRIQLDYKEDMISVLLVESDAMSVKATVKRFRADSPETFINVDFELRAQPVRPHGILGQTALHLVAPEEEVDTTTPTNHILGDLVGCDAYALDGSTEDYVVRDGIVGVQFVFSSYVPNLGYPDPSSTTATTTTWKQRRSLLASPVHAMFGEVAAA